MPCFRIRRIRGENDRRRSFKFRPISLATPASQRPPTVGEFIISALDDFPQFSFGKGRPKMDKVISVFNSFAESDEADKNYYRSLSPEQRLQILLALNRRWPTDENAPTSQGLARVYRVIKFP
jgi:hypothetical protein